jgi:uncharacterized repeat protein (TIGR01451 family)
LTSGDTAGLTVQGNAIGTDATGVIRLGNLLNGVCLGSSSNMIGGTILGAANLIEFNGSGRVGAGVQLVGAVTGNSILSNAIESNAGLGINLGSGPTPNHAPGTPGPNNYQNYPVLSLVQNDGTSTKINGTLSEEPNTSYLIQFFASPQADPSGYGQGQLLVGSMSVQTDAQGIANFSTQLPPAATPGEFLSATATDASGNTSEFARCVMVQGVPVLVLSGTATPNPVADGADLTYTLKVTNQGTAAAHNILLKDQIPSGVSLVSVSTSQGFVFPPTGGAGVQVALQALAAGNTATVTVVVRTSPTSLGTITDTASVSSQETPTESIPVAATVLTAADVAVALAAGPSSLLAGGDVTFTMTVSNLGPQGASDVQATLPLGPGLTYVSATSPTGTINFAGGQVVAQLGILASGGQAVITVVARTTGAGDLTETAAVTSGSLDANPTNDFASAALEVDPACDLSVKVTADTTVAASGVSFDYTVTVVNNGPCDATSFTLTDALPDGVTVASISADSVVTPSVIQGVLTAQFATLVSGSSASIVISVTTTASPGAILTDVATLQETEPDPNPLNSKSTLVLPVRGVSNLSVTATPEPGPYHAGQPITYTVVVTNNGPEDEPDAVLGGAVPQDATVDSTSSTRGADPAVSHGIMAADLGAIPAGQSATVTITISPGAQDVGTMIAGFSVQGQDYDPDSTNNATTVSVPVAGSSDLSVQIIPANVAAVAQIEWAYTLVIKNEGPSAATNVAARIPVPAGSHLVSALSSQGQAPAGQGGLIAADLGTILSGGSATITVVIDPTAAVGGQTITLAAQVSGDQDDPNPADNVVSMSLAVGASVNIALALHSTPQVLSGQTVTFTATVTNFGSTPATGVIVNFPQVGGLNFVQSSPSQGTPALVTGQYFARLGDLAPGASATVEVMEQAMWPGNFSMTATVSEAQFNLNLPAATATTSAQVLESPGMLQFGSGGVTVTDRSGVAVLPVVRVYGASGSISVHYQTAPLSATPGLDFTPISGTLTLGPGQWTGSIQIPILDDPYLNRDTAFNVTLDSPTNGAYLGSLTTSQVHIQDVDPDLTPPQVSQLTWAGNAQAISSLTVRFNGPLDPAHATDGNDYHLVNLSNGQALPIASITYDPTHFAVTIVPQAPIPSGQYTQIQLVGSGTDAIRDLAGNSLDGVGDGTAGTNYLATFAQGNRLRYLDKNRNLVKLSVRGPGYLEQVLDSNGDGVALDLVGMVPHRTTLKGRIKARKGGSGQTELGTISGLGQFGQVKVLLKSPPFRVSQLPFQRRGKLVL